MTQVSSNHRTTPEYQCSGLKNVIGIVQRIGCVNVVGLLTFNLVIFFVFCVFDILRIIQMNEEVALICGYTLLIFDWTEDPKLCIVASISIQFFFTAAFTFFLLEGGDNL